MKKILLVCDCHFSRLALKTLFEVPKYDKIEFVSIEWLITRSVGQITVLIHLTESNFSKAFLFIKQRRERGLNNVMFLAHKRLISLMHRLYEVDLRFIEERSSVEVFLKSISGECNPSGAEEKKNLLSPSEFFVLTMMMAGLSPATIALRTKKSIKTISSQKVNALRKLNLDNKPHSFVKLEHCFLFLPRPSL